MRLGINGLPDAVDELAPGQLYMLNHVASDQRLSVLTRLLRSNCANQIQTVLVSAVPPEILIDRFCCFGSDDLLEAVRDERLVLLTTQSEFASNIFRHGPERLTAELALLGVEAGALLIVDQADTLFTLHDPQLAAREAEVYRAWCRRTGVACVLSFLLRPERNHPSSYRVIADRCSGVAALRSRDGRVQLWLEHWHGAQGGRYEIADPAAAGAVDGPGEGRILHNCAEWAAVGADRRLAYLNSFLQLVGRAHQQPPDALVLAEREASSLSDLVQQVFLLRQVAPAAKILLKEGERRVRYGAASLLFQVGVSQILSRDFPVSHLTMLLGSLKVRQVSPAVGDSAALAASAEPAESGGLLSLDMLRTLVAGRLEQAGQLDLCCQLVLIKGLGEGQVLQLLRAQGWMRSSDAVALGERGVLLFLFGCGGAERELVLRRLFPGLSHSHFFSCSERGAIENELAEQRDDPGMQAYLELLHNPPGRSVGRVAPAGLLRCGPAWR